MGENGEKLVLLAVRFAQLGIKTRVFHGDGDAPRQVVGHREIGGVVTGPPLAGEAAQHADRAAPDTERDPEGRGLELRLAAAQHVPNPLRRVRVERLPALRCGLLGRFPATMGRRHPAERAIRAEQIDGAPIGEERDDQRSHVLQGALHID